MYTATLTMGRTGRILKSLTLLSIVALCACGGGGVGNDAAVSADIAPRIARAQAIHNTTDSVAAMAGSQLVAPNAAGPWTPNISDTWQWQLTGTINTGYNVKVYDVDLFDTSNSILTTLHSQGKHVVCYFSAGSGENWRPDYVKFNSADLGNPLDGWAGERWLDTRSSNVRSIMSARLDLAKSRGCDGVEPDNVDAYTNQPGFSLTALTQLDYNRFLASEARARGLKVALKNDVDQIVALQPYFDFAINEQCHQYNECVGYSAFTSTGKPVFNAEYKSKWASNATERAKMCASAVAANLRTLVLPMALNDRFRYSCD